MRPPLKHCLPVLACLLCLACQPPGSGTATEAPALADPVSMDELLITLRPEVGRQITAFHGEDVWTGDWLGRLFRSTDSGGAWTEIELPSQGLIQTLEVSRDGKRILIVNEHGVLMRSDDSGASWTQTDLIALVDDHVDTKWGGDFDRFKFDDSLTTGIWIEFCQLFKTRNAGSSWTRHADALLKEDSDSRCVGDAIVDPVSGSLYADVEIYGRVLTSGDYLFRSDDNGRTWTELCSLDEVGLLLESVPSCEDDASLPVVLDEWLHFNFPDDKEALGKFSEQADNAIYVDRHLVIPEIAHKHPEWVSLTPDPVTARNWHGEFDQLAYTDDNGEHWQVMSSGSTETGTTDYSLGTEAGYAIYSGRWLGLTDDVGLTWRALNESPRYLFALSVLPEHERVVLGTEHGISVVDTNNHIWQDVGEFGSVNHIVVAGDTLWAFSYEDLIHRSVDGGLTWATLQFPRESRGFSVDTVSCNENDCILVGWYEDRAVARISAEPTSFEIIELADALPASRNNYFIDAIFHEDLTRGWLAFEEGLVFGTEDGGQTWDQRANLDSAVTELSRAPNSTNIIARGYDDLYLWSGDGETFSRIEIPVGDKAYFDSLCWIDSRTALSTAYDEEPQERFYLLSLDGGRTWAPTDAAPGSDDCLVRGGVIKLSDRVAVPLTRVD